MIKNRRSSIKATKNQKYMSVNNPVTPTPSPEVTAIQDHAENIRHVADELREITDNTVAPESINRAKLQLRRDALVVDNENIDRQVQQAQQTIRQLEQSINMALTQRVRNEGAIAALDEMLAP